MNSKTLLRKISFFKAISHYFGFKGPIDVEIEQTRCTEFGGELRNKQRTTLEGVDMKHGRRFNQRKNIWNINVCDL